MLYPNKVTVTVRNHTSLYHDEIIIKNNNKILSGDISPPVSSKERRVME